jgi:plastocyanin
MRGSRNLRFAFGAALSLLLAGSAAAKVVRVEITKLAFVPETVVAEVGDTIEWINNDFVAHTATATDTDWDVTMAKGESGRIDLESAGRFEYFCRFHPNMRGSIEVAAP